MDKLDQETHDLVFQIIHSEQNTQQELQLVVEKYIYVRKGVQVSIRDMRYQYGNVPQQVIIKMIGAKDLPLLFSAYESASSWFEHNKKQCLQ